MNDHTPLSANHRQDPLVTTMFTNNIPPQILPGCFDLTDNE